MKVNIGPVNALYPMPVVIVGTEIDGKPNYITIAHVGIIDMNTLSISMGKVHHSNKGIKEHMTLSINFPTEEMVVETDYIGIVSGAKVDKSGMFEIFQGELKAAPMLKAAPLAMECQVIKIIDMSNHDVFLVKPVNTFCNEEILKEGKVDFNHVKPMLFDMPTRRYWKLGEPFAQCWSVGKQYKGI